MESVRTVSRMKYPKGIQDFAMIREDGFVYIDKTRYIYNMTHGNAQAVFLSRPRRFGKSLLCSTLEHYFLGHREMFEGLAIDELETEWTPRPVFSFDMSQAKLDDVDAIKMAIASMLRPYEEIYGREPESNNLGDRLKYVITRAHEQSGQRVAVIIDEYDSPVLNVIEDNEKTRQVRDLCASFYAPIKYMAKHLRFVFLTGITKFSQMSIFSTLNNLDNISMMPEYEAICGITMQEIQDYLLDGVARMNVDGATTVEQKLDALRRRYDGYHFSKQMTDVFNPFSLLKSLANKEIEDHWFGSATPSSLITILKRYNVNFENIEGVQVLLDEFNLPYDVMETPYPIMYQSGYLTIKAYDSASRYYTLGIPNGEVYSGLYLAMMPMLNSNVMANSTLLRVVKQSVIKDDIDTALGAIRDYLAALPYDLGKQDELYYERTVRVICDCLGINCNTEVRTARGRVDCIIEGKSKLFLLEFKVDSRGTVDDALSQINDRDYLVSCWDRPQPKVKVGVVVSPEQRTITTWKIME